MKIYVSFDGDHIGRMIGRMALQDKPEEVRKLSQTIDRGNKIWQSWAEAQGGTIVSLGGDEGRLEVESDHLTDLPALREQYKSAVDSTVSVGVGMKLSEADKALLAAKLQGGDRIQLYSPEVEEILANAEGDGKDERAKIVDEYLDPSTGLQKAQPPAKNQGAHAGMQGPSQDRPAAPQAPQAAPEHSEVEALNGMLQEAGQGPQEGQGKPDYEQLFHQLAQSQQPQAAPQGGPGEADKEKLRETVVNILQSFKTRGKELAVMKQQNPELYQSLMGLVKGMIEMARQVFPGSGQAEAQPVSKSEPAAGCKHFFGKGGKKCLKCKATKDDLDKAALDPGKTGRHDVNLPVGTQIDPSPDSAHRGGSIKVQDPATGKTKWRQVRANMVMDPKDGTPTSSRNV